MCVSADKKSQQCRIIELKSPLSWPIGACALCCALHRSFYSLMLPRTSLTLLCADAPQQYKTATSKMQRKQQCAHSEMVTMIDSAEKDLLRKPLGFFF